MIFKEKDSKIFNDPNITAKICTQFVYSCKPHWLPSNTQTKQHRSYLMQNGITHYNVFKTKVSNSREETQTPLRFKNMFSAYLKKSTKTDNQILPKLSTLKIQIRSKTCLYEKAKEKHLNDKSLGTDD